MVSITSSVSWWCRPYYKNVIKVMTTTENAKSLWQHISRFSLTVEQILTFATSTELVREVKNLSPNCVTNVLHYT